LTQQVFRPGSQGPGAAEIVAEEAFTPGEKDFNAIITKVKR